jgi:hypothetical protein
MLLVALLGLACGHGARAMPIIVDGGALAALLDDITVGGSSGIDVNADQFLNVDDWAADDTGDAGAATGTVIESGPGLRLARVRLDSEVAGLRFGIYDRQDFDRRVRLFSSGDPRGAQLELQVLEDGSVRLGDADTGVDFAANRFGFYLTDGVVTRFSDPQFNPGMGVHAVFFAGNGDRLQLGALPPSVFRRGDFIVAWEFGDLAEGTKRFDDFAIRLQSFAPLRAPEPGSFALLLAGLAVAGAGRRRVRRAWPRSAWRRPDCGRGRRSGGAS